MRLGILGTRSDGFIGGVQIGHNYQFGYNWVGGYEADIQGVTSRSGTASATNSLSLPGFWLYGTPPTIPDVLTTTMTSSKGIDYLGTVRGRFGFLVMPSLLFYGTGGLAYGQVHASTSIAQSNTDAANTLTYSPAPPPNPNYYTNPNAFSSGSFSDTRFGWTAGLGLEWMMWGNWSAKVEYLYYDLGSATYALSPLVTTNNIVPNPGPTSIVTAQSTTRFNGEIVRIGLNFHFN